MMVSQSDSQDTEREHNHDHKFLLQAGIELIELLQREHKDDYIDDDIEDCTQPPLDVDVVA